MEENKVNLHVEGLALDRKKDVCSLEREKKKKKKTQDQANVREILKWPLGKALGLKFVDPGCIKIYW